MEPTVVDKPESSRFEIVVDGQVAGFASYERTGTRVLFAHTEVDESFEGRGLGSILARDALDASRSQGLSVLPFCPFIRVYIKRHPEYLDLVPASLQAGFGLARPSAGSADRGADAPSGDGPT